VETGGSGRPGGRCLRGGVSLHVQVHVDWEGVRLVSHSQSPSAGYSEGRGSVWPRSSCSLIGSGTVDLYLGESSAMYKGAGSPS
jgi:hypothetical protein